MCHKWDRGECRYHKDCWFGVHRCPVVLKEADAAPRPKCSDEDHEDAEAATKAMMKLLMKEKRDQASCKRLLLALHPDKVQGTHFQLVFEELAKKINAFREQAP